MREEVSEKREGCFYWEKEGIGKEKKKGEISRRRMVNVNVS